MSIHTRKTIFFCLILLLWSFLALPRAARVYAQDPTPTPDPTIVALEAQVSTLSTQVANFETQVSLNKEAVRLETMKELNNILIAAGSIAVVGFAFGLSSPFILYRWARERTKSEMDKAIFRANPTRLPVYVPHSDFEGETRRLRRLGFRVLRPYTTLHEVQPVSIVIYRAKDLSEIKELEDFLREKKEKDEKWKPDEMAFIIYTSKHIQGGDEIYKVFDNITFANNTITVATHIYALARGLIK